MIFNLKMKILTVFLLITMLVNMQVIIGQI